MSNETWDKRHLRLARFISRWSKDPKKKVGAVITENSYVRGVGYNGFPRGIEDSPARLADQMLKLQIIIHAESNALSAANGVGDCIYVYPFLPCPACLSNIIQHRIKRIVSLVGSDKATTKWQPDLVLSLAEEANIKVDLVSI